MRRLVVASCCFAFAVAAAGCDAPAAGGKSDRGSDTGAGSKSAEGTHGQERDKAPKPLPISQQRQLKALQAEVEVLKHQVKTGKRDEWTGLINAHEHMFELKHLENYLPAARQSGVAMTVLVASPEFTIYGKGDQGEPSMSENFERLLEAARAYPDEVIPFCTLDPEDKDALDRLKKHVAAGAKGLKLYTGHSNFYKAPLDDKALDPVFAYLEETQLPVNWHINLSKFMDEFENVLKRHPKLNVMVPHYGVAFWRADGDTLPRLSALMKKYPNVYVDTSLGTREILLDGMVALARGNATFQKFFVDHSDQIMWGTDSVITGNPEKTTTWFTKVIRVTRDHLETDVFTTDLAAAYSIYFKKGRDADGRYEGLNLPPEILRKVYIDNARRWLRLPAAPTKEPAPTETAPTEPAPATPPTETPPAAP